MKISRNSGASGRLVFSRPGNEAVESVTIGGAADEIRIRQGLGEINHDSQTFRLVNTGAGGLDCITTAGNIALRGHGSNTGLTMFGGTRNILIQNAGTVTDAGFRLDVQGTSRFNGNMNITGSQTSLYFNYISNPNAVATAAAKLQLVNAAGNSSVVSIASNSDATDPSLLSIGGSNKGLELTSNSVRAFRIFDATRNVIIQNGGTFTDAGYRLDVQGTSRFTGDMQVDGISTINNVFRIRTSDSDPVSIQGPDGAGTTANIKLGTGPTIFTTIRMTRPSGNFASNLSFYTSAAGSATQIEALRIFDTQNVSIGSTTDAGYRLNVSGSTRLNGTAYVSGSLAVNYPSLPSIYKLGVSGSTVVKEGSMVVQDDSGNYSAYTTDGLTQTGGLSFNRYVGPSLYSSNTNPIKLLVNGSELARINATNVTLGSTNQNLIFTPTAGNPTLVQNGSTSSLMRTTSGTRNLQLESYSGDSNYLSANGAPFTIRTTDSQNILFRTNNLVAGNISSAQNWTLGGSTDAGFKLDVQGTSRFNGNSEITGSLNITGSSILQGTPLTDAATLSGEQLTTGTGTNWTGTSFATGYTHTVGSTTPLVSSLNAGIGTYYQMLITISGRTAGSISITFGTSTTGHDINTTSTIGFRSGATTPVFTVTPTTNFDGTVVVSVKYVTSVMPAISTYKTSTGINTLEIRSNIIAQNTFIGVNSGRYNTTGSLNTVLGYNALPNNIVGIGNTVIGVVAGVTNTQGNYNTYVGNAAGYINASGSHNVCIGNSSGFGSTGGGNTFVGSSAGGGNSVNGPNNAVGYAALNLTTTGASNDAYGYTSLYSNTIGSYNVGIGREAGYSNTTGDSNQFIGFRAGRYITDGAIANAITANSIYIGHLTKALANNQTNQIVIGYGSTGLGSNTTVLGNSSTLTTAIYGNTLIGTTTDAGFKLDVNGTSRFNGNMQISGSGAFMAMTSNAGDAFAFKSNGPIRLEAQNVGVFYASTTATALYARGTTANIILANQTTNFATMYGNTGNLSIQNGGTYIDSGYKLDVSGSVRIRGYANTSISSSLLVYGSGSSQPVFTVQGSQGELFSVTDSLSGSLFSVNDISGLPVLEAFSDNTVLLGSYQAPSLLTTNKIVLTASGNFTLSSLPTASYDGAFYEYTARSGSNARAGSIMAIWSGSSVNFTETTTLDFGSTTGLNLGVFVSSGNMVLTGSASTTAWTIKTIVRSI